jgi:rare lipoprotein A
MRRAATLSAPLLMALLAFGCATARPRTAGSTYERGVASWYGPGFHGRATASGERYDMDALTAAHPSLPFGTLVEVVNLDNGRRVTVRINDRGPFEKGRVIDLSRAAARAIGMLGPGTARVELVAVGVAPAGPRAFAVQVGAFRDARALSDELAARYPAVTVRSDRVWHRVQVGSFTSRSAAEALEEELRTRGYVVVIVPLSGGDS